MMKLSLCVVPLALAACASRAKDPTTVTTTTSGWVERSDVALAPPLADPILVNPPPTRPDPEQAVTRVEVVRKGAHATLRGVVQTAADKVDAEMAERRAHGITTVDNQIEVLEP